MNKTLRLKKYYIILIGNFLDGLGEPTQPTMNQVIRELG